MTMIATGQTNGSGQLQLQERVPFKAYAPIESVNALKSLMDRQKDSIAQMLPRHITPERLFKTLLVATNRNPEILKCTQGSILETINRAAELGLDLSGTLGEAYPVPFNNKIKIDGRDEYRMQLQLVIGYRGMEKLAWQTGEVESIDAEVVRTNDRFVFRKGTEVLVEWEPNLTDEPGDIVGAYACVKLKNGGKLARFLTRSEIEKIRNSSKSKNSPAWSNWWTEMARKCVLKRTLKDAPLSTEKFVKAMETDAEDFRSGQDVLEASTSATHSRTASLLERVKGAPSDTGTTVVPEPEAIEQAAAADAASEGETIDAGTGEVRSEEAEVPAQGEEPKPVEKDPAAFLSHGTFLKALEEVAAGSNVKPSEIGPWLEQYQANNDLVLGVRTAPKVRQEAFDAFVEFVASRG